MNIVIWYQGPEDEKPIWYTETAERQATIPDFKIVVHVIMDNNLTLEEYLNKTEAE